MRHTIVGVIAVLLLIGGCWVAKDRSSVQDADPAQDVFAQQQQDEEDDEPVSGADKLDDPLPDLEGEHYEAFDLLVNRPLAHRSSVSDEGRSLWVVGGNYDFVRHVLGNHTRDWLLERAVEDAEGEDGVVAGVRGSEGTFSAGAYAGDAEVLEARVFNPAIDHNEMTVTINGEAVGTKKLDEGWQTVKLELPEEVVGDENEIFVRFSNLGRIDGALSGGGFDWVRIGPEKSGDVDGPHSLPQTQEGPLQLGAGEGLSWVVWWHDDASVQLEIEAEEGCGPRVEVETQDGQGGVEEVGAETLELVEGRGDVQTAAVSADVDSSEVARVHVANGPDGCDDVAINDARLMRPGTVDGVPDEIDPPKYVVFWMIDTLRADYLPIHFDIDVKAPNLKRLAEEGVSFEVGYVQGTESRASHATLFTGNYPDRHGVMAGGTVDPHLPIIPHFFQDEGYKTANLVANGYVSHLLNLDRGWDYYRNYIHEEAALDADSLLADGLEWVDGLDDADSFFLYLGTIDPHATYWRHDDFIELYEPADYQGRFQRQLSGHQLEDIKAGAKQVTDREKERIINLYKNEITYNDHVFGKMREDLEERGIWEDTLVVVTADHGEEFWEHGSVGHGHNVHQEMVHVPLMFHYPGGLPEGRTVRSGGEVVDVLPTLLDLLGVEAPDDRQGRSLLPTIFEEHGGYPAPALATQYQLQYGMQIRDWKLYLTGNGFELFDRSEDPLEMEDVADDHPLAARWLQDSVSWFRAHREDWQKAEWGVANNVSDQFLQLIGVEE